MEKRKIEPNDLYEFPLPYDVTCSPDGKYAAYLFAFLNKEKDCCESELRVLCLETGEEKVLTATRDVGAYKWISSTEIMFSSRRSNRRREAQISTSFLWKEERRKKSCLFREYVQCRNS